MPLLLCDVWLPQFQDLDHEVEIVRGQVGREKNLDGTEPLERNAERPQWCDAVIHVRRHGHDFCPFFGGIIFASHSLCSLSTSSGPCSSMRSLIQSPGVPPVNPAPALAISSTLSRIRTGVVFLAMGAAK